MNQEKNEHRWSTIRDEAIDLFAGEVPGAQLEQDIITHFVDDPERVIRAITRVATQEGVNSRWAVLRADLNRTHQSDVVASNMKGKQKAIERARQWIDNAGIHYDHERHITAELFGDDISRGRIQDYHLTDLEKQQLVDHYHANRHRGEQAERDHEAWAAHCVESRARVAAMLKAKRQETECQTTSYSQTADPSQSKTATPPTDSSTRSSSFETTNSTSSPTESSRDSNSGEPDTIPTPDADDIPHFTPTGAPA